MLLGRASLIIVIVILMLPCAFQGAFSETPPPHENFEEAEENLEILMSVLEDSKLLCENTLRYFVNMEFSPQNFSIAMAKANEFHESLLGMETLLEELKGKATSFYDLKEYLIPFQNLDLNTTSLIGYYSYYFENLTSVEDFFNDTVISNITVDSAFQSLNNTESNIELLRNILDGIKFNTDLINQKGFSTIKLEELINESRQLIDTDENITKELAKLFIGIPSFLSLYVNKIELALGDELIAYGYFFSEGSFKSGQNITVFMDSQILDEVSTNSTGRYEIKKNIPLNHTLGEFEIYSSTIYNYFPYESNRINITIGKIPTKLLLSTPFSAYSPNQPIQFSGRLIDYRNRSLADKNITLYFDDPLGDTPNFNNITITNISTDFDGNYSFELDTIEIPIGIYGARAKFESEDVYSGNVSGIVNVSINIPTDLTLSILETVVYQGENITFSGQLIDELDNILLSNMPLEIFIEDEKVGEVVTNNAGQYEYKYSTFGMAIGKYNVHSEFDPIEIKWREAVSNIIEVEIKEPEESTQDLSLIEKIYDNLFLIVLFIIVFLLPAVLYIKKKRYVEPSVHRTQQLGKKIGRKSYPGIILTEKELKDREDFDSKLRALKETKKVREAIIMGYLNLLNILEKHKIMRVEPSYTHLDIQKKLTDKGFPITDIRSVTEIFENAMYSNRPIESDTFDDFMTGARKMFTQARRTKG